MTYYHNNLLNKKKSTIMILSFALSIIGMFFTTSVFAATVPTCTITADSETVSKDESTTLHWKIKGKPLFASIDNKIGMIPVDPVNGRRKVTLQESTTYKMHVWDAKGNGEFCKVEIVVGSKMVTKNTNVTDVAAGVIATGKKTALNKIQPNISVNTVAIHPAKTKVVLQNVPYTGPTDDILYMTFLIALIFTATYAVSKHTTLLSLIRR